MKQNLYPAIQDVQHTITSIETRRIPIGISPSLPLHFGLELGKPSMQQGCNTCPHYQASHWGAWLPCSKCRGGMDFIKNLRKKAELTRPGWPYQSEDCGTHLAFVSGGPSRNTALPSPQRKLCWSLPQQYKPFPGLFSLFFPVLLGGTLTFPGWDEYQSIWNFGQFGISWFRSLLGGLVGSNRACSHTHILSKFKLFL